MGLLDTAKCFRWNAQWWICRSVCLASYRFFADMKIYAVKALPSIGLIAAVDGSGNYGSMPQHQQLMRSIPLGASSLPTTERPEVLSRDITLDDYAGSKKVLLFTCCCVYVVCLCTCSISRLGWNPRCCARHKSSSPSILVDHTAIWSTQPQI